MKLASWIKRQYNRYKLKKELRRINTTLKALGYIIREDGGYKYASLYYVNKYKSLLKRKEEIRALLNYI